MSTSQDLLLAQFRPASLPVDNGKESVRMKRALEEQWHQFSSTLDYSESNASAEPDASVHVQKHPQQLLSMTSEANVADPVFPEVHIGKLVAAEAGLALSLRTSTNPNPSLGAMGHGMATYSANVAVMDNPSAVSLIQSALQARAIKYAKTSVSLTSGDEGLVVWLRDFQGDLAEDLTEVIGMITEFFHDQNIAIKAIMLNGKLYRAMEG